MAKILIAEDNFPNQRLLSYRLQKQGHEVIVSNNGVEALEHLKVTTFDLAILDIAMPLLDGITLLSQIRSSESMHSLPIIILTASALESHNIIAVEKGVTGFLSKPISSNALNDAVKAALGS